MVGGRGGHRKGVGGQNLLLPVLSSPGSCPPFLGSPVPSHKCVCFVHINEATSFQIFLNINDNL